MTESEAKNPNKKRCSKCKEYKPANLDHFYKDARSKSGLSSWCRECQRTAVSTVPSEAQPESRDNDTKPDTCLVIDFADHSDLLEVVLKSADKDFRTPEKQVLWWIHTGAAIATSKENNPS